MTALKISVAVATCGRPDALRTCLRAMAEQTRAPDQLIVVDQQPLEATREVVAQSGLFIEYIEQDKRGLSASRNRALDAATGAILAVTDEDCFASRGWIEAALEGFGDADAVTGPILPPPGDPPPGMCPLSLRLSRETKTYVARTPPWEVGSGANFAARVETLRKIGGWDERLGVGSPGLAGEDIDIVDRLLASGGSITYLGDAAMHHAWQTRERRRETRWSYGYGIGAMSGLRLGRRDSYGLRTLAAYSKMQLRGIGHDVKRRDWIGVRERITSLSALGPSLIYGFRVAKDGRDNLECSNAFSRL